MYSHRHNIENQTENGENSQLWFFTLREVKQKHCSNATPQYIPGIILYGTFSQYNFQYFPYLQTTVQPYLSVSLFLRNSPSNKFRTTICDMQFHLSKMTKTRLQNKYNRITPTPVCLKICKFENWNPPPLSCVVYIFCICLNVKLTSSSCISLPFSWKHGLFR